MLDSIQNMVHNIRTGFGDSSKTYGGEDILPEYKHHLQGLNQGNRAGPTIWLIISLVIFEILWDRGYGTTFISSVSKATLKLVGFSYVDDCDLFNSAPTMDMTFTKMKASLSDWESLIEVTGGCLVPNKSSWYLVDYLNEGCYNMIPLFVSSVNVNVAVVL